MYGVDHYDSPVFGVIGAALLQWVLILGADRALANATGVKSTYIFYGMWMGAGWVLCLVFCTVIYAWKFAVRSLCRNDVQEN
jgi:hypothetical protein